MRQMQKLKFLSYASTSYRIFMHPRYPVNNLKNKWNICTPILHNIAEKNELLCNFSLKIDLEAQCAIDLGHPSRRNDGCTIDSSFWC